MENTLLDALQHEWQILHRDHERYEQFALVIKLFAVVIMLSCWVFAIDAILTITFILVLWLQEGIWKTYQARLGARLLLLEPTLREPGSIAIRPYQLYSAWAAQPKGMATLVAEYVTNAIRPTVAYPYAFLVALAAVAPMLSSAPF